METKTRHQANTVSLSQKIAKQPANYEFIQVIRLLSRFSNNIDAAIQFKVNPAMRFAVAEIEALQINQADTPEKKYTVFVNFMGLIGQDGIMPHHISHTVLQRLQAKDNAILEFLNIFQHHLLQLYAALLTSRQFYINAEQHHDDVTLNTLNNIAGQAQATNDTIRHHAGLFAQQTRSAEGLAQLLTSYFEIPIMISHYTPKWITLADHDITYIGKQHAQQHILGKSAILGARAWHVQNQFTVWIGPLDLTTFNCFLPKQDYLQQLTALVRDYSGMEHDFTVKLLLDHSHTPCCKLSYAKPEKLGWTTWLNNTTSTNGYNIVTLTDPEAHR